MAVVAAGQSLFNRTVLLLLLMLLRSELHKTTRTYSIS
jgi:hypothetical protein